MKTKLTLAAMALSCVTMTAHAEVTCSKPVNQLQATTPSSDFVFHNDGTVTHKRTGLMWQQCMVGQTMSEFNECIGTPTIMSWDQALQYAQSAMVAGHNDWRLASVKELSSIMEMQCHEPVVNEAVFPTNYSLAAWSSTPVSGTNRALTLSFGHGVSSEDAKRFSRAVRLVRDTQ